MNLFGQPRTITTPDGTEWTLGRLTVAVIKAFAAYVTKAEGDPFEMLERFLGKLPDSELMPLFKEAKEVKEQLRCFSMACPLAQKHLKTETGIAEIYRLLLLAAHPKVTAEDALQVAMHDAAGVGGALEHAEGTPPKNERAPAA